MRLSDGYLAAFPLGPCFHVSTVRRGSNRDETRTELSAARLVDVAHPSDFDRSESPNFISIVLNVVSTFDHWW